MGGLLGAESSEEEPYFMQEVQSGRILVSVEVEGDEAETEKLLTNSGAMEVDRLGTGVIHAKLRHPSGS